MFQQFILWVLVSLAIGSFLNVVIYRVPKILNNIWRAQARECLEMEPEAEQEKFSIAWPPSTCPHCNNRIRFRHNIPVLGWLILKGRCHDCSEPISARYPLIELLTGLLAALTLWQLGLDIPGYLALGLTFTLIALAWIDIDTQYLPDVMTLPLLWAGLIVNSFGIFTDLTSALWGAIVGYMSLWLVFQLFKLITGKEGMGYGDFKLLAALGAWMGWQALAPIILLSSVVGAIIGIGMILLVKHDRRTAISFGPYLAAAGWLMLVFGDQVRAVMASMGLVV